MHWILQRQEERCYGNLLADLIHTAIPEYQNFIRIPLHQEVSYQFLEALRSWTAIGNNTETPGNRRDLHLTVSMASWPNHHLQIRPPGLTGHPC